MLRSYLGFNFALSIPSYENVRQNLICAKYPSLTVTPAAFLQGSYDGGWRVGLPGDTTLQCSLNWRAAKFTAQPKLFSVAVNGKEEGLTTIRFFETRIKPKDQGRICCAS